MYMQRGDGGLEGGRGAVATDSAKPVRISTTTPHVSTYVRWIPISQAATHEALQPPTSLPAVRMCYLLHLASID